MLDDQDQVIQSAQEDRLSESERQLLAQIRERKAQLKERVLAEDFYALQELAVVADDLKLDSVNELNQKGINRMLDLFKDMTFEQVQAMNTDGEPQ